MESAHHRLTESGEIESSPPATDGSCIAYLVHDGVQDRLCVIEGGSFHTFNVSPQGLARLAEEATAALRKCLVAEL